MDLEDLLCSASTGPPNLEITQTNDLKEVVNKLISNSMEETQKRLAHLFICSMMSLLGKSKCSRNPSLNWETHGASW